MPCVCVCVSLREIDCDEAYYIRLACEIKFNSDIISISELYFAGTEIIIVFYYRQYHQWSEC